jgi:hypothetical protein
MTAALWSASLAVLRVLAAVGAELVEGETVGVVPTVLLRDVVAVLAVHTRHRDLRTDIGALAGHGNLLSGMTWVLLMRRGQGHGTRHPRLRDIRTICEIVRASPL